MHILEILRWRDQLFDESFQHVVYAAPSETLKGATNLAEKIASIDPAIETTTEFPQFDHSLWSAGPTLLIIGKGCPN